MARTLQHPLAQLNLQRMSFFREKPDDSGLSLKKYLTSPGRIQ